MKKFTVSDKEILELYKIYDGSINKMEKNHSVGKRRIWRVLRENGIKRGTKLFYK